MTYLEIGPLGQPGGWDPLTRGRDGTHQPGWQMGPYQKVVWMGPYVPEPGEITHTQSGELY